MLPGFVAGHYQQNELEIDLVRLAQFSGARIIFGTVEHIDRAKKRLIVSGRPPVPFDIASIDVGVTSAMPETNGFKEHAVAAKPLGPFANRWTSYLAAGAGPSVVIGGGVAGAELALAVAHAAQGKGLISLVEANQVLGNSSQRKRLLRELHNAGVRIVENATVTRVNENNVQLSNGEELPSVLTIGAAGARPLEWLKNTGLDLTDGYLNTDRNLRTSDPSIFACGDCAHLTHAPRPKAGVFAVRAAPVLVNNIRAVLTERPLKPFKPQKHYLKLVSLGRKSAVAEKWGQGISGQWVWRCKDRIDRAFMNRLNHPPIGKGLTPPKDPATGVDDVLGKKPLCGGCGAKVGSGVLEEVLEQDQTGIGEDAAVLKIGREQFVISTDHLRAFWNDPYVMAQIAAVHSLGDIWSMGAAPNSALSQITLPELSERLQREWLEEITAGAKDIFGPEGIDIVGGHTTMGAELQIGFTVTGVLERPPLTLSGALPGDAIVLTRPIGSGTLMAAEMQGLGKAEDIAAALRSMATTQGDAARHVSQHATAMTDLTGFGFAVHLQKIARASGLTAHIELDEIPFLNGALDLAEAGVRSSIWEANRAEVQTVLPHTPEAALLFDPQTSGGFLATVPANSAKSIVDALKSIQHRAAIVGHMVERGPDWITLGQD